MRELSLHLLDILENSARAGATQIRVTIELDADKNWLTLCVEDDGPGFSVGPDQLLDPFYTTKTNKRTGLGLSLFRAAAQQAGGDLFLGKSDLGGALTKATFQYQHLGRAPLGDMAGTFMALLLSNPQIHVLCYCSGPQGTFTLSSQEDKDKSAEMPLLTSVRNFAEHIKMALSQAGVEA